MTQKPKPEEAEPKKEEIFTKARELLDEAEKDSSISWVLTTISTSIEVNTCGSASELKRLMIVSDILQDLLEDGHPSVEIPLTFVDALIQYNLAKKTAAVNVPPKSEMN